MNTKQVRVFTAETVLRLGLQNRVVRKLRSMGCKVTAASLDSMLTIALEQPVPPTLLHLRGGWSLRRTDEGELVTIEVDGCRVMWLGGEPC